MKPPKIQIEISIREFIKQIEKLTKPERSTDNNEKKQKENK
jgi:hypothetical protein